MAHIGIDGLPLSGEGDLKRKHAVIRFKRAVSFPRFSMAEGERWGFVVYGKTEQRLEAIRAGERFDFAGGQGLAEDVEIVYEGECGREYSEACRNTRKPIHCESQ